VFTIFCLVKGFHFRLHQHWIYNNRPFTRHCKYQLTEEKFEKVFYYMIKFYWEFFTEKAKTTSNDCKLNFTWIKYLDYYKWQFVNETHSFVWRQCHWSLIICSFTIRIEELNYFWCEFFLQRKLNTSYFKQNDKFNLIIVLSQYLHFVTINNVQGPALYEKHCHWFCLANEVSANSGN